MTRERKPFDAALCSFLDAQAFTPAPAQPGTVARLPQSVTALSRIGKWLRETLL